MVVPITLIQSVPVRERDAYKVEFFPEMTGGSEDQQGLIPNIPNNLYSQVLSDDGDDENLEEDEASISEPVDFW